LRRSLVFTFAVVALVATGSSAAGLQPIKRTEGELTIPRVRAAQLNFPSAREHGRVDVIVTLDLPPLAAADLGVRYSATRASRKLSVASAAATAYLARVDAAQRTAVATLKREIPSATVGRRFRIVLNGLTVNLPARRLPALSRLGFANKVYPSFRYTKATNRSSDLIAARAFRSATGTGGEGMKVAVVDDGIDVTNPFLSPEGFAFPAGFPKGDTTFRFTSPKVIVARSFTGRGASENARLPLDRNFSFHGTHVAGVIAGNSGTTAPDSTVIPKDEKEPVCVLASGGCHTTVAGLSGIAPRAWIGNYRVFSVPSPIFPEDCCSANTPEIAAAFEAAVADGMDVINFSGGGPQADPASDAMMEVIANVARAGVVPVISAGNDRDIFGLGSVGSPSTAPDAISVAAVSNLHVFGRALTVTSAPGLGQIPFVPAPGGVPDAWASTDLALVDVGSIVGTNGRPVDRFLCSAAGDPNDARSSTLPERSLVGAIALVSRGLCTFDSKAARASAAGAVGIVVVDNRPGEANFIPLRMGLSGGMISDFDGARLRSAMASAGGRASIRVGRDQLEIDAGRGGTVASFSAGGLTSFGHELKPDLSAPGAQILSSTTFEFAGALFAVLDGTSFSAPHVAGAAALLLQRHPTWTVKQVKSALMSTAGPAYEDTARTKEASVFLQGAGMARLTEADNPRIFTDPQSLSFRLVNVAAGAASRPLLVTATDAGGGGGAWSVELQPQAATAGATVNAPGSVSIPPGGQTTFQVVATASAGAAAGDNYGFVVLRQGGVTRRIPYGFAVTRPQLAAAQPIQLRPLQNGDTRDGADRARAYRWPTTPFAITGLFGVDQPVDEDGREDVYFIDIPQRATNVGVAIAQPEPNPRAPIESLLSAPIHPWFLGSLDENDVMGYAGTPVNVNSSGPDYLFNIAAAGTVFAPPGRYFVSVDSGRDPFTGRSLAGPYVLRSWVNDVRPPTVQLVTTTVSAGYPSIVIRATDAQSGVDPLAASVVYADALIGATLFDSRTGLAVIPIPRSVVALAPGRVPIRLVVPDYQESKNVNVEGDNPLPNTALRRVQLRVVRRPTVTWLSPSRNACARGRAELTVVANSSALISSVGFYDGARQIARVRQNEFGVYRVTWRVDRARRGKHTLRAVASDLQGREASASRPVRVCP
jgi:minor extracellular serine protease Vpr